MTDPTQKMIEIANRREELRRELEQRATEPLREIDLGDVVRVKSTGAAGVVVTRPVNGGGVRVDFSKFGADTFGWFQLSSMVLIAKAEQEGPSDEDELCCGQCGPGGCGDIDPVDVEEPSGSKAIDTPMRQFETGATRNNDSDALDYEGFLSPLVLQRFAEYMHKHRFQADGQVRSSDNWQKGIPLESYMKSGFRHFMDWWVEHRGLESREGLEDALCALLFNVQGYLHETLKARNLQNPA